jgi:putative ABC transport system permease protein
MTEIYRPTIYVFNQQYFEKYCTSLGIKGGYDDTVVLYNAAADYSGRSEKRSEPVYDIEDGTAIHLGIAKKMQGSENAADPEYVDKEIMITKVTDSPPRGYENVFTDGGFLMVSEHFFTDEEKELYDYYTDDLFVQAEDADELQKELEDLKMSGSPYNQIIVTNSNEEVRTSKNLMLAIEIFLYGFITVITLIGVTNIFNTISTGMSLRAREFAMLRSVGMTNREFNRMIRLESLMYGSRSLLIGLPV